MTTLVEIIEPMIKCNVKHLNATNNVTFVMNGDIGFLNQRGLEIENNYFLKPTLFMRINGKRSIPNQMIENITHVCLI